MEFLQSQSRNRIRLSKTARSQSGSSILKKLLDRSHEVLSPYIGELEKHLKSVPFQVHFTDRELLTSREQYYIYMIEFELANRLHIKRFKDSKFKIALLPYCLKESHENCKASPDEIDYKCSGCHKSCYIKRIGDILREHGINSYILSRGRVGKSSGNHWDRDVRAH